MKDHCGFLSALNAAGGAGESRFILEFHRDVSKRNGDYICAITLPPIPSSSFSERPFSGGSGRKWGEYCYTLRALTHICTTELSQAGKWMGDLGWNSYPHLVLGIVLERRCMLRARPRRWREGWRCRGGGLGAGATPRDKVFLAPLAACYVFIQWQLQFLWLTVPGK